ncbi:MAG TPA: tripartite tricarboxylate transporter substrate binding protein [Burkholderiales bacterium]|nr:tripartite tricarboxylate transporter substrate binding protein [Burkholderiales bacterium]
MRRFQARRVTNVAPNPPSPRSGRATAARAAYVVACIIACFAAVASAQTYPVKTVRVVVPFAPGGGIDLVARIISQRLQENIGQSFIVDNRPGGGGIVGSEVVATARADGYTLLAVPISHAANVSLTKLSFDPIADFAPIVHIASAPNVVLVHPSLPVKTIGEFTRLARQHPGQLSYASSGNGSSTHLAAELFKMLAKVDLLHVPYKGGGLALTDLLGGQVSMYIASLPAAMPHVRSGKLKGLAVTSTARANALPDMPTVAEAGVSGYEYVGWYGMLAPAGTASAILDRLNVETNKILRQPPVVEKLAADGAQPVGGTPGQFGEHIRNEIAKWAQVVAHARMRAD